MCLAGVARVQFPGHPVGTWWGTAGRQPARFRNLHIGAERSCKALVKDARKMGKGLKHHPSFPTRERWMVKRRAVLREGGRRRSGERLEDERPPRSIYPRIYEDDKRDYTPSVNLETIFRVNA